MIPQRVRFCTSRDGVRIAYAVTGSGPPLVRAPHWLTHIEYDAHLAVRRHWIEELSRFHTLVRFDPRGCGLSDRNPTEYGLENWVDDLEAVVESAGLDRFALLGPSQGGAVAITYAVRHPARVTHLALYGAFARGKLARGNAAQAADAEAQLKLVELGWGSDDPAYRQVFASQIMPGASAQSIAALAEMMRLSATPESAARVLRMIYGIDVTALVPRIACPTLVFHSRGDRRVPYEEGRLLAAMIPGARLVSFDSINHMLPAEDPSWRTFIEELNAFLLPERAAIAGLSPRESEVLAQLARGFDNARIAGALGVSEKTIRNHLTRIFDKMGVQQRGEAIVRAREAGFGVE